jgi:predicted kinase
VEAGDKKMSNDTRTIILTVGVPGSGKDTWAEQEMRLHPGKYKRVNRDLFRKMLDNEQFSPSNEKFINVIRDRAVEYALSKGFDVILSDTNLKAKNFSSMVELARRFGNVRVMEKKFDVPVEVCKERNRNRERVVPEHVIDTMYENFRKIKDLPPRDVYVGKGEIEAPEYDPNKKDCIIVDIDGTIARNVSRSIYDLTKVYEDEVIQPIVSLVNLLGQGRQIIFLSGRDGSCYEDTLKWLIDKAKFDQGYFSLFMRSPGDSRKDSVVKKEILLEKIAPFNNVDYVIDDRPQVVRTWRSLGYTVLQVNDLEF